MEITKTQPPPDPFYQDFETFQGTGTPIVIDHGKRFFFSF